MRDLASNDDGHVELFVHDGPRGAVQNVTTWVQVLDERMLPQNCMWVKAARALHVITFAIDFILSTLTFAGMPCNWVGLSKSMVNTAAFTASMAFGT